MTFWKWYFFLLGKNVFIYTENPAYVLRIGIDCQFLKPFLTWVGYANWIFKGKKYRKCRICYKEGKHIISIHECIFKWYDIIDLKIYKRKFDLRNVHIYRKRKIVSKLNVMPAHMKKYFFMSLEHYLQSQIIFRRSESRLFFHINKRLIDFEEIREFEFQCHIYDNMIWVISFVVK